MLRGILDKLPQSKRTLIEQAREPINERALAAIKKLQENGWTQDGSLHGIDFQKVQWMNARLAKSSLENIILREANLAGAYFGAANLSGADLHTANLQGANLSDTQLKNANLSNADLQQSHLAKTDLTQAKLVGADLRGANLWCTHLHAADLRAANLRDAKLSDVILNEQTRLPDGSLWTSDADLTRFTDPQHPHFWTSSPN